MTRFGGLVCAGWMLAAAPGLAQSAAPAAGDAAKGKVQFERMCTMCHQPAAGAMGPALGGVFGRKAGAVAGFRYSPAMTASGVTWDAASLESYLAAPTQMIKGSYMMINVPQAADRADVIAYLKTLK